MSYLGSEMHTVFDLGNQHNNGPHQDQIFGNPIDLCFCLALWALCLALCPTPPPRTHTHPQKGGGGGGETDFLSFLL